MIEPEAALIRDLLRSLASIHQSQIEVGRLLGKHAQSISDYLTGKKLPDAVTTVKILRLANSEGLLYPQPDRLMLRMVYQDTDQEKVVLCRRTKTADHGMPFIMAGAVASYQEIDSKPFAVINGQSDAFPIETPPDHEILGELIPLRTPQP